MTRGARFHPLLALAALALALGTARLGVWQLDRADEKTRLQQLLDERGEQPPLEAAELPGVGAAAGLPGVGSAAGGADVTAAAVAAVAQRRARLVGRWQADATVALDNRPMAGRVGFYVVTPLVLADGSAVLVQRGWIPRDLVDRTRLAPFSTPAGEVVVQGRIAPRLPRLFALGDDGTGAIRQNLDIETAALETRLALRPWVLIETDAAAPAAGSPAAPPDGLLRDWPQPDAGVAKHHGYAFQWFALSALTIGLYVWFQFLRPRRDARPEPR